MEDKLKHLIKTIKDTPTNLQLKDVPYKNHVCMLHLCNTTSSTRCMFAHIISGGRNWSVSFIGMVIGMVGQINTCVSSQLVCMLFTDVGLTGHY